MKGSLRNPGQATAENVRMSVAAIDEKGQPIDGAPADALQGIGRGRPERRLHGFAEGRLENGGEHPFQPAVDPAQAAARSRLRGRRTAAAPRPAKAAAPTPVRTPYGQGTLYAAPVASAPSKPPADGKTGYIPGATSPDNQPKPPNR